MEATSDSDYVNDLEESPDGNAGKNRPSSTISTSEGVPINGEFESIFRGTKLKRRRTEDEDVAARKKKIKPPYNEGYLDLFNGAVEEALGFCSDDTLGTSQIGVIEWSGSEKATLLGYIAKHGQGDLGAISSAIGTKSLTEVSDYLIILRRANQGWKGQSLQLTDVPSAVQLSEKCCAALDRTADGLALRQLNYEEELERSKHGNYWLLNESTASELEAMGTSDETAASTEDQPSEITPDLMSSIELLNLSRFIELSSRVFMNPGPSQSLDNWFDLATLGETPAMFATAFTNFSTLVSSFTKRLVSTTLFLANSRLRASDVKGWRARKLQVKRCDVRAALRILNLKHNSDSHWEGVARRLGLEVYDVGTQKVRGFRMGSMKLDGTEPMTYDEVERRMRERSRSPRSRSLSRSDVHGGSGSEPIGEEVLQARPEGRTPLTESIPPTNSRSPIHQSPPPSPATEALIKFSNEQDTYASSLDRIASVREEQHLWSLLGEEPPSDLPEISELEAEIPKQPKRPRKLLGRVTREAGEPNWRDRVEYRAEWERYGVRVPEETFVLLKKRVKDVVHDDTEEEDDVREDASPRVRSFRAQTPAFGQRASSERSDGEDGEVRSRGEPTTSEGEDMDPEARTSDDAEEDEQTDDDTTDESSDDTDNETDDDSEGDHAPDRDEEGGHIEYWNTLDQPPTPRSVIPSIENRVESQFDVDYEDQNVSPGPSHTSDASMQLPPETLATLMRLRAQYDADA